MIIICLTRGGCLAGIGGRYRCHMAAKFYVFIDKDHGKLLTLYWLHKLHKIPYKSCFIANFSSLVHLLLLSCLYF